MGLCGICRQDKDNTIEVLCRIGGEFSASWHMICEECGKKQEWRLAPINNELVHFPSRAGGSSIMSVWKPLHLRPQIAATVVFPGTPQPAPAAPPIHYAPPPIHYAPPLHYAPPSQSPPYITHPSASPQPYSHPQGGVGICPACNVATSKCEKCHQKFCSAHLFKCDSHFDHVGSWRCRRDKENWDKYHN